MKSLNPKKLSKEEKLFRGSLAGLRALADEVYETCLLFGPQSINWDKVSLLLKEYPVDSLLSLNTAKKTKRA